MRTLFSKSKISPGNFFIKVVVTGLIFTLSFFPLKSFAIDMTVIGKVSQPLEISLSPADEFSRWQIDTWDTTLIDLAAVNSGPAEMVFRFHPKAPGTGKVTFYRKVIGTVGAGSRSDAYIVQVMIQGTKQQKKMPGLSAGPMDSVQPDTLMNQSGTLYDLPMVYGLLFPDTIAASSDQLYTKMLHGSKGFPAKNQEVAEEKDKKARWDYDTSPVPWDVDFLRPKGSYLFNPSHIMPLPDTPPGMDNIPPEYKQAMILVRRGLYEQALEALEELRPRMAKNPRFLSFYEYVQAHVNLSSGDYDKSKTQFKKLIFDKDFGRAARFYMAYSIERAANDTPSAIAAYEGVLAYNPRGFYSPEAAYRIASMYNKEKAYDIAINDLLRYIRNYRKSAFIDDALFDLARIYDQVYAYQDFDKAIYRYNEILTNYPDSPYKDTVVIRKKFITYNYFDERDRN